MAALFAGRLSKLLFCMALLSASVFNGSICWKIIHASVFSGFIFCWKIIQASMFLKEGTCDKYYHVNNKEFDTGGDHCTTTVLPVLTSCVEESVKNED
jgi:hypothetical protein